LRNKIDPMPLSKVCINYTFGNPTYTPTVLSKDWILQKEISDVDAFDIPVNGMDNMNYNTAYLYLTTPQKPIHCWIQQMLYQAFIPAPHQNINKCEGETQLC
jgi:hypothetical protein